MANCVIVSDEKLINFTFNDQQDRASKQDLWVGRRDVIEIALNLNGHTKVNIGDGDIFYFTVDGADNTIQVDTVDGVSPVDNSDLADKISALVPNLSLALNDLTDVDTATDAPATGDLLVYNGTEWVPDSSSGAPPASSKNYVYAYDTTTQNIPVVNTYQNVNYSTNAQIQGWTHTPGTANFTASKSGLFAASVEFNVEKSGGGNVEAGVRALFNGVVIPGSQNGMDLTSNNTAFSLSRTFLFIATAGQDFVVQLSANSSTASIVPSPNPGGSSFVSATLTIRRLT